MSAAFVLFRVISWIDFGGTLKAIHKLTRRNTKTDDISLCLDNLCLPNRMIFASIRVEMWPSG